MTDGTGRFVFQQLVAGTYGVRVEAPGYFEGGYGMVPGSEAAGIVTLAAGQWFAEADLALWKPAAISGAVRDERGEAVVDVPVRVLLGFALAGRDQWALGAVTRTDDRGAYRFAGLLPGRYVVQVPNIHVAVPQGSSALSRSQLSPQRPPVVRGADGVGTMVGLFALGPSEPGTVYPAAFYPAGRSPIGAEVVVLEFGGERTAVDVSLVPVPAVRVSGKVVGAAEDVGDLPVRLLAVGSESLGFGGETALTKTDREGAFAFAQVPEGDYTVVAGRAIAEFQVNQNGVRPRLEPTGANPFLESFSWISVGAEPNLLLGLNAMVGNDVIGHTSISVGDQAVAGLLVPVTPGVAVSGRALFDGADSPAIGKVAGPFGPRIGLEPADGDLTRPVRFSALQQQRPAGPAFTVAGVVRGRYRLVDGGNGAYRVVGATWNGQDLFRQPFVVDDDPITGLVVRLSSRSNSVSGFVRGANAQLVANGAVLFFPQDRNLWREPGVSAKLFRRQDVSLSGAFSSQNLLPGDYFVVAVPVEDRRRGLDLEFLAAVAPFATRLTIGESDALTLELRMRGSGR